MENCEVEMMASEKEVLTVSKLAFDSVENLVYHWEISGAVEMAASLDTCEDDM